MQYSIQVIETVALLKTYIVEASSTGEAMGKAEIGDTVEEFIEKDLGVYNRQIDPKSIRWNNALLG